MNKIPDSHKELLQEPFFGVLTTLMPKGMPQSSIVWVDWDGTYPVINTTKERQKGKNLMTNSKCSLIIIDPKDSSRWISIQGDVIIETTGALDQLDKITQQYTKYDRYYGNIYPEEQRLKETRIKCMIKPEKVFIDAIHK